MPVPKILIIPGSLRTGSHNARLAALAAKELALAEGEVTRISLEDYPLPLFDADLAASSGMPAAAPRLKAMLMAHQGVFITSPEYSGLGDAAAQERHRLGVARARRGRADLCRVQESCLCHRVGDGEFKRRRAFDDGAAADSGTGLRRLGHSRAGSVPRADGRLTIWIISRMKRPPRR